MFLAYLQEIYANLDQGFFSPVAATGAAAECVDSHSCLSGSCCTVAKAFTVTEAGAEAALCVVVP